jgi:hypothetical protein
MKLRAYREYQAQNPLDTVTAGSTPVLTCIGSISVSYRWMISSLIELIRAWSYLTVYTLFRPQFIGNVSFLWYLFGTGRIIDRLRCLEPLRLDLWIPAAERAPNGEIDHLKKVGLFGSVGSMGEEK